MLDDRRTEQRNPRSAHIDTLSSLEIVDLVNAEDRRVADAVAEEREAIARAMDLAVEAFRRGGRLIYVGAGTSGRLGVLASAAMPPTFGPDPGTVQGLSAAGAGAWGRPRTARPRFALPRRRWDGHARQPHRRHRWACRSARYPAPPPPLRAAPPCSCR